LLYRPSEWLRVAVKPDGIYRESKLNELRHVGIAYADGVLTSLRAFDRPYPTIGRHSSIELHRPNDLISVAADIHETVDVENLEDGNYVFGWEVIVAVWKCCGPIASLQPPSTVLDSPERKARVDIRSLERIDL